MANPAFWRELAATFLQIPGHDLICAEGYYKIGSGESWTWRLSGSVNSFIQSTFESLATRGASEIAPAGTTDLFSAWLEAIRHERIHFRSDLQGSEFIGGNIYSVCEASATLCRILEKQAIQAAFEEKQRNDPKNWSQFRQQYEAFKSMREIVNGPAERIPEEWVRNAIARIQGIKPEDVTRKQIAFEVAGLLSSTKRHIELIPSTPTGTSPAPEAKPNDPSAKQAQNQHKTEPPVSHPLEETLPAQIHRLREECRWSVETLAGAVDLDLRTVTRHLSGKTKPHLRNISAYERAFSKALNRRVVIKKMP